MYIAWMMSFEKQHNTDCLVTVLLARRCTQWHKGSGSKQRKDYHLYSGSQDICSQVGPVLDDYLESHSAVAVLQQGGNDKLE